MSTNGTPIRILLVGEAREASRLRDLLVANGLSQFSIAHAGDLEGAAQHLSRDAVDALLLDLDAKPARGSALIRSARAVTPNVPIVILSESDDESLAVESLQHGAQDFLSKRRLEGQALARALRYAIERHRLQKTVQSLTVLDDLTGLHNRRGFLELADQHLRFAPHPGASLLVYLDLDGLKPINDTYGHLEGNRALVATASVLRACFRQSDILARLGGDEFCVLMTEARLETAQTVNDRLQRMVDFANASGTWQFRLSLSVGIVEVLAANQTPLEELLRLADERMYARKRNKPSPRSAPPESRRPVNA